MSSASFVRVSSKAVPLLIDDLDTDIITPIGRVLQGREIMLRFAFEPIRFDDRGMLRPECALNDPAFAGAEILLAGANFGCGSSRETAAWAVKGMGFRAVIAPSFGPIFEINCFKNGILPVRLPPADINGLAAAAVRGEQLFVDLDARTVGDGTRASSFEISDFRREGLLRGLDELDLILARTGQIEAFEIADRKARPWAGLSRAVKRSEV